MALKEGEFVYLHQRLLALQRECRATVVRKERERRADLRARAAERPRPDNLVCCADDDVVTDVTIAITDSDCKAIGVALIRIGQGTYGLCQNCGADIPLARLRAKPFAALCTDCKTQRERAA